MDACHIELTEIAHARHLTKVPARGEVYTLTTGNHVRIVRPLNAERTNFLAEILPVEEEDFDLVAYLNQ